MVNTDILWDVYERAWFTNSVISQKLKYFGHVKPDSDLERTVVEGMVPGRMSRGWPEWTQDMKDTLGMKGMKWKTGKKLKIFMMGHNVSNILQMTCYVRIK